MERKGYLSSHIGEPTGSPGGRARRCFRVETPGREALKGSLDTIRGLLEGLETSLGGDR